MEHHRLYNNAPLHWGYSSSPHTIHNTWVPPSSRGVKRSISESDCDDNYSETSSKETSPKDNDADSCQHLSRKKRRGVIEKKRRDRINSSLSELKRLVPSAYEKQGSSKLEKAEILQLTVDHLKTLHAKGVDSMAFDPQRYAMDYHVIGFQECVSEVARYLITHEGMDIQNPLRMRLLSHLRCFAAQREISIKSGNLPPSQNWSPPTPHPTTYPLTQTNYGVTNSSLAPPLASAPLLTPRSIPITAQPTSTSLPTTSSASPMYSSSYSATAHNYPYVPNLTPTASGDIYAESNVQTSGSGTIASVETAHTQLSHLHNNQQNYVQHHDQNGSTYTDLSVAQKFSNHYSTIGGFGLPSHEDDPLSAAYSSNNNKPYRPWGGPEMAY